MNNIFNSVLVKKPKKNVFDLSHDVKYTGIMGKLIPNLVMECVPGDQITLGADTLLRFAPLTSPVMHRIEVTQHYFFVPNRILWENWEDFITDPSGATTNPAPFLEINGTESADEIKFLDYCGIPPYTSTLGTDAVNINALPFAAIQKIYNEYYRDENLAAELVDTLVNGDNAANKSELLTMSKRAYKHDYFTAALPFAQKGAAVDIPLGDVVLKDDWITGRGTRTPHFVKDTGTVSVGVLSNESGPKIQVGGSGTWNAYDPDGTLQTESTTINDLRRAFRLQEWLEKNARGGTRYIENILVHFGVKSSDKRLQRPEYITGSKTPVVISEVLNTSGTFAQGDPNEPTSPPQGSMAGHGVTLQTGKKKSYFAEEHGFIIGLISVMPLPAYMQGIHKQYLKLDPLEYYWPSFAHIGEQEIDQNEIYAYQTLGQNFGYIPRYAEYKYKPNRVAGDFRSTLKFWTLTREFATQPLLNQDFLEVDDDLAINRIFAVADGSDNLYINTYHKIKAVRPMPVFGTPLL